MGIEIGKRSLMTHTLGLNTVGHNLSNASVDGYSRQRVEMHAPEPIYMPDLTREERPGQVGQGVDTLRVTRLKDELLEGRIVAESSNQAYWTSRDKYLLMLEQVYNEPMDLSLRSQMDRFWEAWQELSLHPEQMGARKVVLERGEELIEAFHSRYERLKGIRDMVEDEILGTVQRVNDLGAQVAALNEQVVKVRAMGDNPNDILDRRDLLIAQMSSLVEVTVGTRDPDEHTVHTAGMHLVQGKRFEGLVPVQDPANEGYSRIFWEGEKREVVFRRGTLGGLMELRDGDIREEIQKLDLLALNFVDLVNEIHRGSYGLDGRSGNDFFVEYPFINNIAGNYDRNGDGAYDASYIFRVTGGNALAPKEQIGLRGTLTLPTPDGEARVEYFPTDTVEDLVSRINLSHAEVVARLDQAGHLSLKALPAADPRYPDFVIRHLEDSGQFLVGYAGILRGPGPQGSFDWEAADAVAALQGGELQYAVAPLAHPAGWIGVNPALARDPVSIAASSGMGRGDGGPGDGSAARAIASLRTDAVMIGSIRSFDDYFAEMVAGVGLRGEEAARALDTEKLVMKNLADMQQAVSGVNLDEELTTMIKYQHGYTSAARFITTFDQLLETIINRMGV
jgi:flagellar hook-associated protein 1 FlgK